MTFYYGYYGAKYSSPDQLCRAYRAEVRRHQRAAVSYTHLDVYKRQPISWQWIITVWASRS